MRAAIPLAFLAHTHISSRHENAVTLLDSCHQLAVSYQQTSNSHLYTIYTEGIKEISEPNLVEIGED